LRASAPSSPVTPPQPGDISKEDSGEGATERLRQYDIYRQCWWSSTNFHEPADAAVKKIEVFESEVSTGSSSNWGASAADRGR